MKKALWFLAALALLRAPLQCQEQAPLICAGGTFPAPIYQRWIEAFEKHSPGLPIVYHAVGSGAAVQELKRGAATFAASDFPLDQRMQMELGVRLIPTVVGAAVPAYNIPDQLRDLRFTPQLLAAIYLGAVTRWDDPQIKALNREARLPPHDIVVVHRSDGSGTSYLWTDFLSRASVEWRDKVGASVMPRWPLGREAAGNAGVADLISRTPFSIGYVEFTYALTHRLSYGPVKNAAGNYIQAGIDSLTAAASAARMEDPNSVSIVDAPGRDAYPIASFTWMLVPVKMEAGPRRERFRAFLDWALSMGQRQAGALGYIALPPELAVRERGIIAHLWRQP